ncbi:cholestenol Delta-isomerase [Geosmithia morbida]|uniref:Cholestenol Delta-isomerase n=1 Tax=Geosmithia morbida TaxID=1094350 RepID=A0A9P5D967_9HYPO|nr:cholestenol Delta-isomerase [Geosmithia morbida]KAF4126199.1 cholestenol Delta-isomerase [Geosmithia morbida]
MVLVSYFSLGAGVILTATLALSRRLQPNLSAADTLMTMWFVLCGFIHLFFEGYYAYNFSRMPSRLDLFGQLWKEYSLSDSRYLTLDSFLVPMESVTALCWGPMSFACAAMIVGRHPLRHVFQTIISLGQLYGDVLYFGTSTFTMVVGGVDFCRPEMFYYWAYYFFCNAIWIVIPFGLVVSSSRAIEKAIARVQMLDGEKKGQ